VSLAFGEQGSDKFDAIQQQREEDKVIIQLNSMEDGDVGESKNDEVVLDMSTPHAQQQITVVVEQNTLELTM